MGTKRRWHAARRFFFDEKPCRGGYGGVFESLCHYRKERISERAHGYAHGAMDERRASGTGTREGAWTAKTRFRVGCTSLAHGNAVLGCCTLVNRLRLHQAIVTTIYPCSTRCTFMTKYLYNSSNLQTTRRHRIYLLNNMLRQALLSFLQKRVYSAYLQSHCLA
jgi:hypothetical protein